MTGLTRYSSCNFAARLEFLSEKPRDFVLNSFTHSLSSHKESPDRSHPPPSANGRTGILAPKLELIGEDDTLDSYDLYDPYGDDQSEHGDMDFLEVELVRSKFSHQSVLSDFSLKSCVMQRLRVWTKASVK